MSRNVLKLINARTFISFIASECTFQFIFTYIFIRCQNETRCDTSLSVDAKMIDFGCFGRNSNVYGSTKYYAHVVFRHMEFASIRKWDKIVCRQSDVRLARLILIISKCCDDIRACAFSVCVGRPAAYTNIYCNMKLHSILILIIFFLRLKNAFRPFVVSLLCILPNWAQASDKSTSYFPIKLVSFDGAVVSVVSLFISTSNCFSFVN